MDKKVLSVAIMGSRGIPNRYGGFETLAEELSLRLSARGHRISVYTVAEHPVKDATWKGVVRIMKKNPEKTLGTAGQFIYDLNCILHSRKNHYDILLHLGYTSDSVWYLFWPKNCIHIMHMDGIEWKRSKYNRAVRAFLRLAERLATLRSHWLIADSGEIENYLSAKYSPPVRYIAYGADIPENLSQDAVISFDLTPGGYDMIVARMEPENNIEMAIKAKIMDQSQVPLLIIGNENSHKRYLVNKYDREKKVMFREAVYDRALLDNLRYYSRLYVHGHSAGGTNPSLLEAMACRCRIVAHANPFNRFVLGENGRYYSGEQELTAYFDHYDEKEFDQLAGQNLSKIKNEYNWDAVADAYEKLFYDACNAK